MASVSGFISILNSKFAGETFQIIPAYSFESLPSTPFATWRVSEAPSEIMYRLDGRTEDAVNNVVIDKANFYEQANISLRVYSYNKEEAFEYARKLLYGIKFQWKYGIIIEGYGIISCERAGELPEKLDEQYLQCYVVNVVVDFNNEVERNIDYLEEVDLTGDVEKTITIKEG
jgi:hypothetical protein